ncbi:MAG: hypothetical protein PHN88_12705 [Ignavibacteria bacterium]|nr:hypothetical protein [Ignavibacteria bacterium]
MYNKKTYDKMYGKFIGILLLISTATFLFNYDEVSFLTHLNGLRDPMLMVCSFIITMYIINEHSEYIVPRMNKLLIYFCIINIPVSFYQFSLYGASDGVGGTFLLGGSGLLTQILFLINFFLVLIYAPDINSDKINIKKFIIILLLLFPTFINETKISYPLFALYFVFLFKGTISITKSFAVLVLGFIILNMFQIIYFETLGESDDMDIFTNKDYLTAYLFSTEDKEDMSRFGRVEIAYDLNKDVPHKLLLGNGYGIFKGQNILGTVKRGDYLNYLYKGTVLFIFDAFMQGGIFLIIYVFLFFWYAIYSIKRGSYKKIINFRYFIMIFIFIAGVYNTFYFESFCIFITAYIINYLRFQNNIGKIQ